MDFEYNEEIAAVIEEYFHAILAQLLMKYVSFEKYKAWTLASRFADIDEFTRIQAHHIKYIRSIHGKIMFILTDEEIERVLAFSSSEQALKAYKEEVLAVMSLGDNYLNQDD